MHNPKNKSHNNHLHTVLKSKLPILLVVVLVSVALLSSTTAWLNAYDATAQNVFVSGKNLDLSFGETVGDGQRLVPSERIAKDPTVTVEAGSEPCYLFVKGKGNANAADFLDYNIGTEFLPMSEFVIDGKLDPTYQTSKHFYFDSANDTYDDHLTAYLSNGGTTPFTGTIDSNIKMWVAYDSTSVYVYFKMYTPHTTASVRMYYDPDPTASNDLSLGNTVGTTEHGDVAFRVDYSGTIAGEIAALPSNKAPYCNTQYFQNGSNLVHFTFSDSEGSGYGFEVRLPRKDDDSGTFKLNFAAESNYGDNDTKFAWSFGPTWWISRTSMHTFDFNNTFVSQNYDDYYYRIVGDVEDGPLTESQTFQILEGLVDNDRNGTSMANGYVTCRSQKRNGSDIVAADLANPDVSLYFRAVAIQQKNLTLSQAFSAVKPTLDAN